MDRFLQRHRTRFGLLTVLIILLTARPQSGKLFVLGTVLVLYGAAIRLWASGFLVKLDKVTTEGPYAKVRNPLYIGTFFSASGICLVSQSVWAWGAHLLFFLLVYPPTIRAEEAELEKKFGDEYRAYKAAVPRFIPALFSGGLPFHGKIDPAVFRRNKEWLGLAGWLVVLLVMHFVRLGVFVR